MDKLSCPGEIAQVMDEVFGLADQAEEYVYLLAMTAKCRPISFFEVSHGTCSTCVVMPREVMVRVLLCGAVNIIIIHNHPSGSPQPSREDRQVTERIREASDIIGIRLCDHIIVAGDFLNRCHNFKVLMMMDVSWPTNELQDSRKTQYSITFPIRRRA